MPKAVEPPSGATVSRPAPAILIGSTIVALEGVAVVGLGVAELFTLHSVRLVLGLTNAFFFMLYGAGLIVCGWGLMRRSGWSRAPIVIAQVIELGLAWSFAGGSTSWLAWLLAVPAAVALIIVLAPSTTRALYPVDDAA